MSARTVLAMIDIAHRDNAIALCQEAAQQVRQEDDLHVAYVMPYGHFSYVEPFVSEESVKAAAERAHQDLDEIVASAGLNAEKHVLRGGVGEQTILLSSRIAADLILVNAHRPDVKTHSLGSYAAQIVRHAPCSVLVKK